MASSTPTSRRRWASSAVWRSSTSTACRPGTSTRAECSRKSPSRPVEKINTLLQKIYTAPVQDGLIGQRIEEITAGGVACAVSTVPAHAERRAPIVQEAGAHMLVVQGTVLTARHISKSYKHLSFSELTHSVDIPIVAGNCVDYATALELMDTGIKGLLVGVGPGAACTTRAVLGVGVPQVTATSDCAAARDDHLPAQRRAGRDHHRRWHASRWRRRQGLRQRRGRGDDRLDLRLRCGSSRPRQPLGHGDPGPESAARHAHPDRHQGHAPRDPVRTRRTSTTAA